MRQADKQQLITTGKVVKIFKPNFDGHEPMFPRIEGTGREGYLRSGEWIHNNGGRNWIGLIRNPNQRFDYSEQEFAQNQKSAGIETAIKELKDLFCNSFKRK